VYTCPKGSLLGFAVFQPKFFNSPLINAYDLTSESRFLEVLLLFDFTDIAAVFLLLDEVVAIWVRFFDFRGFGIGTLFLV
jgi:hypothetical protein